MAELPGTTDDEGFKTPAPTAGLEVPGKKLGLKVGEPKPLDALFEQDPEPPPVSKTPTLDALFREQPATKPSVLRQVGRGVRDVTESLGGPETPKIEDRIRQLQDDFIDPVKQLRKDFNRGAVRDFSLGANFSIAQLVDTPGAISEFMVEELMNMIAVPQKPFSFTDDPAGPVNRPFEGTKIDLPKLMNLYLDIGATVPEDQLSDNFSTQLGRFFGAQLLLSGGAPALRLLPKTAGDTLKGKASNALRELGRASTATSRKFQKATTKRILAPGFIAAETLGTLGAVTGGFIINEKFPDSPVARFFGEVGGGAATQILPSRVLVRGGQFLARKIREPFEQGASIERAKNFFQKNIENEQATKDILGDSTLVSPEFRAAATNAQLSQNPGILSIEKTILQEGDNLTSSDKLARRSEDQIANLVRIVTNRFERDASEIPLTTRTLQEKQKYLATLIQRRSEVAAERAEREIAELGAEKMSQSKATVVANKHVDDLVADLEQTEDALWAAVDLTGRARSEPSLTAWETILKRQTSGSAQSDLWLADEGGAKDLIKLLGGFDKKGKFVPGKWAKKKLTAQEIQDLRSRVLFSVRTLQKTGGSPTRIANLQKMGDSLLDTLGAKSAHIDTVNGQAHRVAMDFSREKNTTIRSGAVGELLRVDKQGQPVIPKALTLETMLVGKGVKAEENLSEIIKPFELARKTREARRNAAIEEGAFAEGLTPDQLTAPERQGLGAQFDINNPLSPDETELLDAVDHFITQRFLDNHTIDNIVKPAGAKSFLKNNEKLLNRFPETRAKIEAVIESGVSNTLIQKQSEKAARQLNNERMSIAALWLGKGPSAAFDDILKSQGSDLNRKLSTLLSKVRKDPSGRAEEGLQAAMFDWLRRRSTVAPTGKNISSTTAFNTDRFLSSTEFNRLLGTEQVQKIIARTMTEEQQNRIAQLSNEMLIIDLARSAKPLKEGVSIDVPGRIRTVLSQILGANTGTRVAKTTGTGGIQLQAIFSREAREAMEANFQDPAGKLLQDAVMARDDTLMQILLMPVQDVKSLRFVRNELEVWLATSLFQLGERSSEEIKGSILDITDGLKELFDPETIDISQELE